MVGAEQRLTRCAISKILPADAARPFLQNLFLGSRSINWTLRGKAVAVRAAIGIVWYRHLG